MPDRPTKSKKPVASLLIGSGIGWLVTLGKYIRLFGTSAVIAFVVGAGFAVVYSYIPSAPLHDVIFPSLVVHQAPEMEITGTVRDWKGAALKGAVLFVASSTDTMRVHVDDDGKIRGKLPSGTYEIIAINPEDPWRYTKASITPTSTDLSDFRVPSGVAKLKGQVVDQNGKGKNGVVVQLVDGSLPSEICAQTYDDGHDNGIYVFSSVPIIEGGKPLRVKAGKASLLLNEHIDTGQTFPIPKPLVPQPSGDPMVIGKVTDRSGRPLPNLRVVISSASGQYFSTITSYNGVYSISVPTNGEYKIEVFSGSILLRSEQRLQVNQDPFPHDVTVQ